MKNNEKYKNHLEQINEVYTVANMELFIYLDLLLLSFFLGYLLYSQMHHWLTPFVISGSCFILFSVIFRLFIKENKTKKEGQSSNLF